jgi:hypothetical protein
MAHQVDSKKTSGASPGANISVSLKAIINKLYTVGYGHKLVPTVAARRGGDQVQKRQNDVQASFKIS